MNRPIALAALTVLGLALVVSCSESPGPAAMVEMPPRAGVENTGPYPGFTLFAPLDSRRVILANMAGEEVHHWDTPLMPGDSCYLTERGTVLACQRYGDDPFFQDAGGHGGKVLELGHDGEILWTFDWNGEHGSQHHDVEELPNGNLLFVAWDRMTREDALAAGRDPELLEGDEWWAGAVYEVKPTRPEGGEIVWSWHAMDHVVQSYDEDLAGYVRDASEAPNKIDINGDFDPGPSSEEEQEEVAKQMAAIGYAGGGEDGGDDDPGDDDPKADDPKADDPKADDKVGDEEDKEDPADAARKARVKGADWMHTNAVAYNAELDQIAISVRRFDEIWIIDHAISREEAKGPRGTCSTAGGTPSPTAWGPTRTGRSWASTTSSGSPRATSAQGT
jgi:hypothetical protein